MVSGSETATLKKRRGRVSSGPIQINYYRKRPEVRR